MPSLPYKGSWCSASWPSNTRLSMMRYVTISIPPHADVAHWHPSATPPCSSLFSVLIATLPTHFWLVVVSLLYSICHLNQWYYFGFLSCFDSTPTKKMVLCFSHSSCSSHLLSVRASSMTACCWLFVVCAAVDWWPSKATVYLIFLTFFLFHVQIVAPNNGTTSLTRSPPGVPPLRHPFYPECWLSVDCWV